MNGNIKIFLVMVATFLVSSFAFAAEGGTPPDQYASLAAGLGIGIAAFGGALGQGKAVASALEGIARNPSAAGKMNVPMILGLVFMESLVLYAFVVTFIKIKTP